VGASALGAVLGLLAARRVGEFGGIRPVAGHGSFRVLRRSARRHLAESVPFAFAGFFAILYARIDVLLLGGWYGEMTVGTYGAAYRLWEAAGLLPASLLDALFPEVARTAARGDGAERLRRLLRRGTPAMVVAGLALSGAGGLAAGWLLPLVYGSGDGITASIQSFRILIWAIPAIFLYLLGGHVLYAVGLQRRVTATMLGIALFNGVVNLMLIPRWAETGAAMTMLISEWVLCALLVGQASRALNPSATEATTPPGQVGRGGDDADVGLTA
jgi:O-antigen/teichoic acid export membrane protein